MIKHKEPLPPNQVNQHSLMLDADKQFKFDNLLKTLPTSPGIYKMIGENNEVIYVGKAKNLKNRVKSYFRQQSTNAKTIALIQQIKDIEITVTRTENEAFLLENTLIKELLPRYNILLRDDKTYPYILLSEQDEYPRLSLYRGQRDPKGRFFGPYPSSRAVRDSLNLLQKLFRLRQCDNTFFKNRHRPCLQYQIKRCTAPCVGYISNDDYQQDVRYASLFLEGKNQQVIEALAAKMETASEAQAFESAAQYRDQIINLRRLQEQQYVVGDDIDSDVIALASHQGMIAVAVLSIRGGRLLGSHSYFPKVPLEVELEEVLAAFIAQYYLNPAHLKDIPDLIVTSHSLFDQDWWLKSLSAAAQKSICIASNSKKDVHQAWLKIAFANVQQALATRMADETSYQHRLSMLQSILGIEALPMRLECFDVSHSMGEATVASCVVFGTSGPLKSAYRRFNIEGIQPGDDYAALHQALTRHFTRLKLAPEHMPDILFIDGGKGQLHQAENVLSELQVTGLILVAIAKGPTRKLGEELLWLSGQQQPLLLPIDSPALHLIQHIRDEAHRLAITGHRQRRAKARQISVLEDIPGIGAKKRRDLLRQLGGLQEVKRATIEELARVPGISLLLAERIYTAFHGS